MSKFKVGDKVQVVDPGNTYTSFDHMFVKLGFKNTKVNGGFKKGLIATVFAVDEHPSTGVPILGLQAQNGSQCLMSIDGVVKISTEISPEAEFDIIREFCDEMVYLLEIRDIDICKYLLKKSCE